MALLARQLPVCLCLLLAVVAFPAPMVAASGECYHNAMSVPRWCRSEFIRAVFAKNPYEVEISFTCCRLLNCAFDPRCFYILQNYCGVPNFQDCPFMGSSKAAVPPAPRHH